MKNDSPPVALEERDEGSAEMGRAAMRARLLKWGVVVACALGVAMIPVPEGITPQAWRLLAIFVATIVGSILRPAPGGAMVLLGITAIALTRSMPIKEAAGLSATEIETLRLKATLAGYADPIVWLVLAAFFISRGMIKTGLGRRIAFHFIRAIGHRSLGLGYALISTDMLLASVIPSNGARSGGIIFPVAKSIAEAYDSKPGPTARRLGAYLMTTLYQCDV
ncbi:MAG: divalent anion:Na+ symporter, family, partial [Blastocatellia bacterium]|nr:divalent anion:Na+ symporter, family [Blastocatellia bacterium]